MNEREIIGIITSNEMPDIEAIRQICIRQNSTSQKRHLIKVAIIVAILTLISGTTALAIANQDAITLYFNKLPEQADQTLKWDYYQTLEEMKDMPDVFLNEDVWEIPNYIGSQHTFTFFHYDEIREFFDVYIGNEIMDVTEYVSHYTHELNDDGEYIPVIYRKPHMGSLVVSTKNDVPVEVSIFSDFVINDAHFTARIYVPLKPDYDYNVFFDDGYIENRINLEEFIYNSPENGINARILISNETTTHNLGMTIQFVYNGVFYQIEKVSSFGITIGTPLETAQMFIDAFKD
ncbi:MAG: hypothetical protein LBD23_02920 [Oscillospiraceae bacterium]|jgi:hypothetical protein|nr:hypothetical protein [Oscillospiraceae bacterium]